MKIFQQNKFETWWENLDPYTKAYLKKQPIWYDSDLFKAAAIGAVVGFLIGLLF